MKILLCKLTFITLSKLLDKSEDGSAEIKGNIVKRIAVFYDTADKK